MQALTKGHIIDDDSLSEDSEPHAQHDQNLDVRHLASMAKYDEEVVGSQSSFMSDITPKDVDVDELARQHKQTGGALSEQNGRRFVRVVNAKVRDEQNAMDDIVDDMSRAKNPSRTGERHSFLVDDDDEVDQVAMNELWKIEVDEIGKEGHETR